VVGAGAIGSVLGARLAESGHTVGLLGREAYVHRIRRHGLILSEPGTRRVVTNLAVSAHLGDLAEALEGLELAIVTTKAYDLREACRALTPFLAGGLDRVLLLQNGVGAEELAAKILGRDRVIAGVITLTVERRALGHYEVLSQRGGVAVAPLIPLVQDMSDLTRLFVGAGLRVASHVDYRAIKWSKLLLNMLGNAIPAIVDLSPAEVYADPSLYAVEISAFREARWVMRAAGVPVVSLPGYPVPLLAALIEHAPPWLIRGLMARLVARGRAGKVPSLQQDLVRGRRRSEVAHLNGAVVREARRLGLEAPANEAIYEALTRLVHGQARRDEFRRTPGALRALARSKGWRR